MHKIGDVFPYPYLWHREYADGRRDATKDRVTCVVFAAEQVGRDGKPERHLFICPITDRPDKDSLAIELTELEIQRAGLRPDRDAYVVVSECNYDVVPGSFNYDKNSGKYGTLSPAAVRKVLAGYAKVTRDHTLKQVPRVEFSGPKLGR